MEAEHRRKSSFRRRSRQAGAEEARVVEAPCESRRASRYSLHSLIWQIIFEHLVYAWI